MRDMKIKSAMIGCIVYRGVLGIFPGSPVIGAQKPHISLTRGGGLRTKGPPWLRLWLCTFKSLTNNDTAIYFLYVNIEFNSGSSDTPLKCFENTPFKCIHFSRSKKGVKFLPLKCVLLLCLFQCVVNFRKNKGNTRAGAYYGGGGTGLTCPPH